MVIAVFTDIHCDLFVVFDYTVSHTFLLLFAVIDDYILFFLIMVVDISHRPIVSL